MTAATPTPRNASQPAAGALRVGVDVSLANILVWGASQIVPSELLGDVENIIVIAVAAGLGALGKYLRNSGNFLGEVL
jgi:hypothetical protein